MLGGTFALVAALPRSCRVRERTGGRLGALAAPGIRTLALTMFPVGFAFAEVAIPAFADAEGPSGAGGRADRGLVGRLGLGGLPMRDACRGSLARVHLQVAPSPLSFLPMALAISPATMALLVVPAGVLIAPMIATRNDSPEGHCGTETEAYTWPPPRWWAGSPRRRRIRRAVGRHELAGRGAGGGGAAAVERLGHSAMRDAGPSR